MARKSRKNSQATARPEPTRPVWQAGAYIRLSAKSQPDDAVATQQGIIRAYVAAHPDINWRETYTDNGVSGMTFERPAFRRLLDDAERGVINCLIVKDLSRLGRNMVDTGYYLEKYFPVRGVRVIAVIDGLDTMPEAEQQMHWGLLSQIKNLVNEAYAMDIGRKTRSAKQAQIRSGAFIGRLPPYGYEKSDENPRRLTPDAEAASVVRQIFLWSAEGVGAAAIARRLNEMRMPTPRQHFCAKGWCADGETKDGETKDGETKDGRCWQKWAVYGILRNVAYRGVMVQGKSATRNRVRKQCPKTAWVVTANTHTPLVSEALWEQAQVGRNRGRDV